MKSRKIRSTVFFLLTAVSYSLCSSGSVKRGSAIDLAHELFIGSGGKSESVVWNSNGCGDYSAAGKQLRVKLSTLTKGDWEGCVTPRVENHKVYIPLY